MLSGGYTDRAKLDAAKRRYLNSEKGRSVRKRYRTSPKGIESIRKCNMRRRHGISVEQYEELKLSQGSRCAVTGLTEVALRSLYGTKNGILVLDHDHVTGEKRGFIAKHLNTVLGFVDDDPKILEGLAAYLRRHGKV